MAFTTAEAQAIRQYLGVPTLNRYRDPRLENAITIAGSDVDAAAAVRVILAKLVTVETDYDAAFADAGLKRADEVEFYAGKGNAATPLVDAQARRGRVQCSRLSQLLGMPILGDYFGRDGFGGDWYLGPAMQKSGNGGWSALG